MPSPTASLNIAPAAPRWVRHGLAALLSILAVSAHAGVANPETPDPNPNLGLMRVDTGGGFTTGQVFALAAHPGGGVIVGGDFVKTSDETVRTHLLRLLPDGRLDADFEVTLSSQGAMRVNAIVTTRDAIYIGGRWTRVNGIERPSLAKLELDGSLIQAWHPSGEGSLQEFDEIRAIAVNGDEAFVGGNIETQALMGLAKLDDATGTIDPNWRALTQTLDHAGEPSLGWRGQVHAMVHTGTDLIVAGNFLQIAGVGRRGVARISLEAPVAVAEYSLPSLGFSAISALAFDASRNAVYVGGQFFVDGGVYDNLIRTHGDSGSVDDSWAPNPENEVSAIALAGAHVYYGGRFEDAEGPFLVRTARGGTGTTDSAWLPLPDAAVRAVLWQRGSQQLWVGGRFVDAGAHSRNGLARYSFAGQDLMFRDGFETE